MTELEHHLIAEAAAPPGVTTPQPEWPEAVVLRGKDVSVRRSVDYQPPIPPPQERISSSATTS